jgi:hypothetical protein
MLERNTFCRPKSRKVFAYHTSRPWFYNSFHEWGFLRSVHGKFERQPVYLVVRPSRTLIQVFFS